MSEIFKESNTSKQKDRSKSEIKATEELERNALRMARQTLSANESQSIQTSNACKFRFLSLPRQRSTQEIIAVI